MGDGPSLPVDLEQGSRSCLWFPLSRHSCLPVDVATKMCATTSIMSKRKQKEPHNIPQEEITKRLHLVLTALMFSRKHQLLVIQTRPLKQTHTPTSTAATAPDPSTMTIEAIHFNNNAIVYLKNGRFPEALFQLKQAAELMYSSSTGVPSNTGQPHEGTDGSNGIRNSGSSTLSQPSRKTQRSVISGNGHAEDIPQQHPRDQTPTTTATMADDHDAPLPRRKRTKRSHPTAPSTGTSGENSLEHMHAQHQVPSNRNATAFGAYQHQPSISTSKPLDACFLRTKPFVLDTTTKPSYTQVSTAILFNMALTYQLSFLHSRSLPKSIENASGLYGMAGSIAMRNLDQSTFTMLLMGSLNNLAVLHYEVGNYGLAREYFDEMSRSIVNVCAKCTSPEILKEKDELLLNTMVLKESQGARAA